TTSRLDQHFASSGGQIVLAVNFNGRGAASAAFGEQGVASIFCVAEDVLVFLGQLVEFGLLGGTVSVRVGFVSGLGRQILYALHDVGHFRERAFSGLQQGSAIVGVAHCHAHAAALGIQASGDLQAGGVVGGAVDAQTGTQTLLVGGQGVVRLVQCCVGYQRGV